MRLFHNLLNNTKIAQVWLTHLWEQSVEQCDTPSRTAPPSDHRQGILQVPASGLRLHFLAVTSRTPPGPRAPPLHKTEAAGRMSKHREEVDHYNLSPHAEEEHGSRTYKYEAARYYRKYATEL